MRTGRRRMGMFPFTTTSWAMLFCLVGCVAFALRWAKFEGGHYTFHGYSFFGDIYGKHFWEPYVTASLCLVSFLFLIVTGPIHPVRWWRAMGVTLFGLLVLLFVIIFLTNAGGLKPLEGLWMTGGAGLGLLLIGAIEARAIIARAVAQPNPAVEAARRDRPPEDSSPRSFT